MPEITKALIDELIIELTALRTVLPDEPVMSTLSLKRIIKTVNNINWALNSKYSRYPSFK